MLFAGIDIGSNAARLLFANVFELEKKVYVEKATLVRIPTRLGEDVYSIGKISEGKADNLIKHYGSLCAVDNISFEIPAGRIIGLIGTRVAHAGCPSDGRTGQAAGPLVHENARYRLKETHYETL